jgi:hypothetical protein
MTTRRAALAEAFHVSERMLDMAAKVRRDGIPELETAIMAGDLKMWPAYLLSAESTERQREILATIPPKKIATFLQAERKQPAANLRQPCAHCNGSGLEPTGGGA